MGSFETVYTDGACKGNPGPGGWAAIFVRPGGCETHTGFEVETTNNRMELMAAIIGVERSTAEVFTLYSDSTYVVKGITEWIRKWRANGWVGSSGPVKNRDLWERLDHARAQRTSVTFKLVKGHAGNSWNERADELAVAASQQAAARAA